MPAREPCCVPQTETRSCHRYALPQHEKQKDPKGSKPVSVAFLVELMRLDVQTPSQKHVKEVPGARIARFGVVAGVGVSSSCDLRSPALRGGSGSGGAPGQEPDQRGFAGQRRSAAVRAGLQRLTCTRVSLPDPGGGPEGGPESCDNPGHHLAGALCPGSSALPCRSEMGKWSVGIWTCLSLCSASCGKKPCPVFSLSSGLCTF